MRQRFQIYPRKADAAMTWGSLAHCILAMLCQTAVAVLTHIAGRSSLLACTAGGHQSVLAASSWPTALPCSHGHTRYRLQ